MLKKQEIISIFAGVVYIFLVTGWASAATEAGERTTKGSAAGRNNHVVFLSWYRAN